MMNETIDLALIDLADLDRVTGGDGINYDQGSDGAIKQTTDRAATCRALVDKSRELSGGADPQPGTDAYALAAAGSGCWASFSK